MAAANATNPPAAVESKTARKKKSKAEAAGPLDSGSATPTQEAAPASTEAPASGVDGAHDSPYLKELNKNIRNTQKKLNAYAKTDAIIAENSGKSLDELVAAKKLNTDQKASILKKPALQTQLSQLEEQVKQYKKFGQHYEDRFAAEKAAMAEVHKTELERVKEEAAVEGELAAAKKWEDNLLALSQFLYAAAAKRQQDDGSDENRAFESLLTMVYQGNMSAVAAIQKLVTGAKGSVMALDGDLMECTYAQVKSLSLELAPAPEEGTDDAALEPESAVENVAEETAAPPESDPTIVHAGMTELGDTAISTDVPQAEPVDSPSGIPEQSSIEAGAANAVAESAWDPSASATTADGWVEVPRDPAETDTGLTNTIAASNHTNSWAEEVAEEAPAPTPPTEAADKDDGFEQVIHHNRPAGGRGRGHRGEFRGRGRGAENGWRGGRGGGGNHRGDRERGERGEHRGRGRGRGDGFRGRGGRGREGGNPEAPANGV